MEDLNEILKFQIKRQFLGAAKTILELSEENHFYIKRLEKLLIDAGFEDFKDSKLDYNNDRAKILSRMNDGWRDLWGQLEMFEIKLKK